ncbi:hypothetical protein [Nitratireductor sp. GCM10026969]|uniref:hypothetical protein n=1 Tax=Nitratireductor sp. GCM10026969 TaxID=3252645 RepID=UPI0036124503
MRTNIDKEQHDVWLGHDETRTANAYKAFDPEYLVDAMRATDSVIRKLQKYTKRRLFACTARAHRDLKLIEGGKSAT